MSLSRRLAAACLAVGLVAPVALPSYAESAGHKLRRERHRAAVLDQQARHQAARVADMRIRLAALDAKANAALEVLQHARLLADQAKAASDKAEAALVVAAHHTDLAHQRLDDLAAGAYRNLAAGGSLANTLSLVGTGNPESFLEGVQLLDQVGQSESNAVDDLRIAEAQQQRAQELAHAQEIRATLAEGRATDAKAAADALVARQHTLLAREQALLSHTRTAAAGAHADARRLAHQIAVARARAAAIRRAQAAAAARAAAVGAPIPTCNGGSVSGYSNGQLPVSALCPLWGSPGQMLRADAAKAFNAMSQAFDHTFGEPLCVTSSYRTYAKQVELYATMPAGYAAVPGTSNHGWGLAVDLCGGIQIDSSPEHIWLLDHAAEFSWFHPAWAMPGGPGPHEPWHWEFAG
jgi:hypothetical protein